MKNVLACLLLGLLPLLGAKQYVAMGGFNPGSSTPTVSLVQTCSNAASSSASAACNLTGVTAGDLIAVGYNCSGSAIAISSVSDGTSSFTLGTQVQGVGTYNSVGGAYLLSANAGNKTYTATCATSVGNNPFIWVAQYHATSGTWHYDTAPSGGGSYGNSTSSNSGNFTTASSGGEAIVCGTQLSNVVATISNVQIGGHTASIFSFSPIATYDSESYLMNTYVTSGACTLTYSAATFWTVFGLAFNAH